MIAQLIMIGVFLAAVVVVMPVFARILPTMISGFAEGELFPTRNIFARRR